jgi:hypothetical protein
VFGLESFEGLGLWAEEYFICEFLLDSEYASGEVGRLYFGFDLVYPLLVLANGELAEEVVGFLEYEPAVDDLIVPGPVHESAHFYIRQFDQILFACGEYFDVEPVAEVAVHGVESHFQVDFDVAPEADLFILDQEGADGRVVGDLFETDGEGAQFALVGLTEDGVEGFFDGGVGGAHEHHCTDDVFHLLDGVGGREYFGEEGGQEAVAVGDGAEHGAFVEYLYRERHVHDRFALHDVGTDLFEDHLEDVLLGGQGLGVDETHLVPAELPLGAQHEEVTVVALVVADGLVLVAEAVAKVVALV